MYIATMNKYIQTVFTFTAVIICATSCTVYYTTSQVDNSLKSSVNQANNSLNNLEYQMNLLQSKYNDIQCDNKPEAMKQSDKMYVELQSDMVQVNKLKSELNQEYTNFQKYTQGKDKISSGTPEYAQLKVTRENIKSKMGNLQSKGELTVKKAQEFSNFITSNVIPNIQMVDVVSYKNSFQKAIADLNKSQQQFEAELQKSEIQINEYLATNELKKPENCKSLKSDIAKLHESLKNINAVKTSLEATLTEFNAKTIGRQKISSCSSNWPLVSKADNEIKASQNQLNSIQLKIQQTMANMVQMMK